jgi:hypothetical protein
MWTSCFITLLNLDGVVGRTCYAAHLNRAPWSQGYLNVNDTLSWVSIRPNWPGQLVQRVNRTIRTGAVHNTWSCNRSWNPNDSWNHVSVASDWLFCICKLRDGCADWRGRGSEIDSCSVECAWDQGGDCSEWGIAERERHVLTKEHPTCKENHCAGAETGIKATR